MIETVVTIVVVCTVMGWIVIPTYIFIAELFSPSPVSYAKQQEYLKKAMAQRLKDEAPLRREREEMWERERLAMAAREPHIKKYYPLTGDYC
jgi:hypothetical protein